MCNHPHGVRDGDNGYRAVEVEMKKCDKDNTPCLHAPCLEVEGVNCCKDCQYAGICASSCFKVRHDGA